MTRPLRIVAAIDFSIGSIDAAKWAASWLLQDGELILTHALVVPDSGGIIRGKAAIPDSLLFNARVGARRRLDSLRRTLGVPTARMEIAEGKPANAIGAVVRSTNADVVVVGKHGEAGPLRGYTGRTADSLVRSAPVPTIVVNGPFRSPPKNIVIALTHSSITPYIVEWTKKIQRASNARITIVHVIGAGTLSHVLSMATVRGDDPPGAEEIDEIFSEDRERWARLLVEAGIPEDCIESEVVFGEVSTSILASQAKHQAQMIIMGSHAGPIKRIVLGSAASAVIRNAEIPVMVVVEPAETSGQLDLTTHAKAGAGEPA